MVISNPKHKISDMTEETKKAMDDAFDIIAELMEHINDINQVNGKDHPNSRDILNRARGVKDDINDEIYKTL